MRCLSEVEAETWVDRGWRIRRQFLQILLGRRGEDETGLERRGEANGREIEKGWNGRERTEREEANKEIERKDKKGRCLELNLAT
jgi:hypothetical protein